MGTKILWCPWTYAPAGECVDHKTGGHPHRDLVSPLGPDDEPQDGGGALVLVWAGDYRMQEVWVASGANVGNWYCLGGEFRRPERWDPPPRGIFDREPDPPRPTNTIPLYPDWYFVLTRGPVSLLSYDNVTAYRAGWVNGRRRLHEEIGELAEDDSGADEGPGR